jgi:hypothetical protein
LVDAATPEFKPWPRPDELDALQNKLRSTAGSLVLVVGESGAGKTVLLRRLLSDALALGPEHFRYINTYLTFSDTLAPLRAVGSPPEITVSVLDQFEQYLAPLRELPLLQREEAQKATRRLFRDILSDPLARLVVAVRAEWYYELRWLDDLIPAPINCVNIAGPSVDPTDPTHQVIYQRFGSLADVATTNAVMAAIGHDGRLLPLEVQIVGAELERTLAKGQEVTSHYLEHSLGGAEGAIARYFDAIVAGAPNPRVALKILCALSARTRFRRQEQLSNILDVIFEDKRKVDSAIPYLQQQRLIVQSGPARFELTHDYLADFFHHKSGSELDPTERDNILFHIDRSITRPTAVVSRAEREHAARWGFAALICVPLIALMSARLLYFGLSWNVAGGGPPPHPMIRGWLIDQTYLPVYLAHLAFVIYVALLYHRFLRHLRESWSGRLWSRITVINMAACVVVAMFLPYAWLTSIAWGGCVVGMKLLSMAQGDRLQGTAKNHVRVWGVATLANMGVVAIFGVAGIALSGDLVRSPADGRLWSYVTVVAATIMIYVCYTLVRVHVQPQAVSRLLGLASRASSGVESPT